MVYSCYLRVLEVTYSYLVNCHNKENQNWNICGDMNKSAHVNPSPFQGGQTWLSNHGYCNVRMITLECIITPEYSAHL